MTLEKSKTNEKLKAGANAKNVSTKSDSNLNAKGGGKENKNEAKMENAQSKKLQNNVKSSSTNKLDSNKGNMAKQPSTTKANENNIKPINNENKNKKANDKSPDNKNMEQKTKSQTNLKNKTGIKNQKDTKTQEKQAPKPTPEELKQREEQSKHFGKYIEESGLPLAFQLIFDEIIAKQLKPELYFSYTAMRLRQLGKEIEEAKQESPGDEVINNEEHGIPNAELNENDLLKYNTNENI
jgi:hypothetical protein